MTARPIRIVPLHRPSELFVPGRPAKAPAAQLTYRGGPLLTSVQVFSVFWGAAWQDPAQQSLVQGLNAFLQFVQHMRHGISQRGGIVGIESGDDLKQYGCVTRPAYHGTDVIE